MRTWLGRLARDIDREIANAAEAVRDAFTTPLNPQPRGSGGSL
jgi:hypothetical protein